MAKVTSSPKARARTLGALVAAVMAAVLVFSPAALGAADPVASGKLKLKLSGGFKKQLKKNHVKMKPRSFKINGGDIDPTTGLGTAELKGKLTFKAGNKKLVYKKLKVKIGKGGYLKGSKGKVFKVKGGKAVRDGFGADISGLKLKFLKSAAKKINKKLDLNSLHPGNAGKATASNVQPEKVTLVSGSSELKPDLGTFAKFAHHCIDPIGTGTTGEDGIAPIPPATATAAPSFVFPVASGQINTDGSGGSALSNGGIQIKTNILNDNAPTAGSGCATINQGTPTVLQQTDLTLDLSTKQIQAHIVISGTENATLDGDKGVAFIGSVTPSAVTTDPVTRTVSFSNAPAAFNATSALVLNGAFPCDLNSGLDPTTGCTGAFAFVAGDPIGTVSFTGQAQ